jgi:arabinofuranan 3-O-arabinosyltransferase
MSMMTREAHATRPVSRLLSSDIAGGLELVGFGLITAYAVFLASAAFQGYWLIDDQGRPIAYDFVNVYAAGRLALEGHAASAYDWAIHKQAEFQALGHAFDGYFGWHYPPTFLFAAAPLALLPLIPATLLWLAVTLIAYVAAIRAIIPVHAATLLAIGFPGVMWNVSVGQNGFLTAALIGGSLMLIERRPLASGVLLGLLTYKPQFGILFPLALALDGRWRVIGAAVATALALAAAAWLVFGAESWRAFIEWMPATNNAVFVDGRVGLNKLQTLFGLVRWLGGSMSLAWAVHGALVALCLIVVALVWRWHPRFEIKAATLVTTALLATPYLFIYDFVVLAVPMAFIMRLGFRDGFLLYELGGMAAASLLILVYPILAVPAGLLAVLIVAALIFRRALLERDRSRWKHWGFHPGT